VIFKGLRLAFFYVFDAFVRLIFKSVNSTSVLLVRLDAIGDFILWIDSAKEYRRLFPDRKIVLCVSAAQCDIAKALPYWDEVWSVDASMLVNRLLYRVSLFRKVRSAGFQISIQPTYSRVFLLGDSIVRASGASQRIGSVGDTINQRPFLKRLSDRWYTKLVPADPGMLMELDRNAEFIRNLSGQNFSASAPVLPKFSPLPDRLKIVDPYFVVFPGASWSGRQWPANNFVKVVCELSVLYGLRAVLCGGPSEKYLCKSIVNLSAVEVINFGGETSLPELIELLRDAEVLISNETSSIHLAAAVSTPAICILGGGHFGRFLPYPAHLPGIKPTVVNHEMVCYQCNWHCTRPYEPGSAVPCIGGVTVASVLASAKIQLRGKSGRGKGNEHTSRVTNVKKAEMNHQQLPLVTVIVAVYNGAGTLQQCIDSVVAQSYRNVELIVIDGGSSDGTVEIMARNIKSLAYCISEPDDGIYSAWNKAIAKAKGDWICFLGADDFLWSGSALQEIMVELINVPENIRVAYGRLMLLDNDGIELFVVGDPWDEIKASFKQLMRVPHPATMHRRSLFERHGNFDETYRIAGDYELLLRELKNSNAVFIQGVILSAMRQGGISSTPSNTIRALREVRSAQRKNGLLLPGRAWLLAVARACIRVILWNLLGEKKTRWLLDLGRSFMGLPAFWTRT
jgi:ADP-heptose:LPS heptosyltransferase/glycosyltransferase involved in cell wall biosynthesis